MLNLMSSSEYDRQKDMGDNEYEMVLEGNEHDQQPEMRGSECDEESKQSDDELHEGEALIAMYNVNESVDGIMLLSVIMNSQMCLLIQIL